MTAILLVLLSQSALAYKTAYVSWREHANIVPADVERLAPVDRVGTPESKEVLRMLAYATDDKSIEVDTRVSDGHDCPSGTAGFIVLEAMRFDDTTDLNSTMVEQSRIGFIGNMRRSSTTVGGGSYANTYSSGGHVTQSTTLGLSGANLTLGKKVPGFEAHYTLTLDSNWLLTDCDGNEWGRAAYRSEVRQMGIGITSEDADKLINKDSARTREAPAEAAKAVVGWFVRSDKVHHRAVYIKGGSEMKAAWNEMLYSGHKDWEAAAARWDAVRSSEEPGSKRYAMATHNLAVFYEHKGDLRTALSMSEEAAAILGDVDSIAYRTRLKEMTGGL